MQSIKAKKRMGKAALVISGMLLATSLAFADTQKVEIGSRIYAVDNQVLVEEVKSPNEYYVEGGIKYQYNYNSLATKEYYYNLKAAKEAFDYINEIRKGKGLEAFEWDEEMLRSATIRSMEIGEKWAHKRPDGTSFATTSKIVRSECLGRTTSTNPKTIVHAWLNSKSGHREALLTTKYKKAYLSSVTSEDGAWTNLYALHQR